MQAQTHFSTYSQSLQNQLNRFDWKKLEGLCDAIVATHMSKGVVYICGNGGSSANAMHLANDLIYGSQMGIKCEALTANSAVMTCLANDEGYEAIFSYQLQVKANANDLLIVLSGSGNSANVVRAIQTANTIGMATAAIVGYSGGLCKNLARHVLHIEIDDMQIAEDFQMILGHMLTQWLAKTVRESAHQQASLPLQISH
jgi:D-sedoheptulose 7-phosphate isomerase